jgi:uncharacterized protein (DUF1501 family)
MKRRTFLRHATHSLALPGLLGSLGFSSSKENTMNRLLRMAAETDKVLVLIYLQGGNDGLNTVIPLDQLSKLNVVRPHVILPENKLLNLAGLPGVALHPSLTGFRDLYADGKLEIIQSVGYPGQSFSHFRSTDIWMSGSASDQLVTSGWTGRYLDTQYPNYPEDYPNATNPDPLAVEIGYGSSLLFQGPNAAMSTVIKNPTEFYQLIENEEEESPNTNAGEKLRYVRLIARQSQQYGVVIKSAAERVTAQKPYPAYNYLGEQLKIVARLIAGGLKTPVYLVNLGGFDTHDAQVEAGDHTIGEHANLLKTFNDAVTAFMADLEFLGIDDRVVGMTFSEFGRRIVSNASLGTDHGSAAPMFVFGNKVRGGVLGNNPVIPSNATYEDNLNAQFDFRQVYASVLEQWFNTSSSTVSNIMLNNFQTVPVIGPSLVTETADLYQQNFSIAPNPINTNATIHFLATGKQVEIKALDTSGRVVQTIYTNQPAVGLQQINWYAGSLSTGTYLISLQSENVKLIQRIVKI